MELFFIPVLVASGIHPALAAAAVFSGTFGGALNPGTPHNAFIAELAEVGPIDVVSVHSVATISAGLIGMLTLTIIGYMRKELKGYELEYELDERAEEFEPSFLKAFIVVLPLIILLLGESGLVPYFQEFGIPGAMIIGSILGILVTKTDPTEATKTFF